jgi:hypothetical protein
MGDEGQAGRAECAQVGEDRGGMVSRAEVLGGWAGWYEMGREGIQGLV